MWRAPDLIFAPFIWTLLSQCLVTGLCVICELLDGKGCSLILHIWSLVHMKLRAFLKLFLVLFGHVHENGLKVII